MRYMTGEDQFICQWVAEKLPNTLPQQLEPCTTLGIVSDNLLVAGCVFNNYRPDSRDIQLTIVADSPRWISKGSLRAIFEYVFLQLNCQRFTVTIAKKNKRARKLAEGVGFKYEGNARRGYDGINDAIIYGMLREECRWIGDSKDGKEVTSTSPGRADNRATASCQ